MSYQCSILLQLANRKLGKIVFKIKLIIGLRPKAEQTLELLELFFLGYFCYLNYNKISLSLSLSVNKLLMTRSSKFRSDCSIKCTTTTAPNKQFFPKRSNHEVMQSILLMKAPYNLRQFGAKINHLDILIFFVK